MFNPYLNYQQSYQPFQTRMVEVVPVDSVDAAREFPVAIGATVMLIAKDDSFVAVKINGVNGQSSFDVYDRRPPEPPAPVFDPAAYVTKDEFESRLRAILKERDE